MSLGEPSDVEEENPSKGEEEPSNLEKNGEAGNLDKQEVEKVESQTFYNETLNPNSKPFYFLADLACRNIDRLVAFRVNIIAETPSLDDLCKKKKIVNTTDMLKFLLIVVNYFFSLVKCCKNIGGLLYCKNM
jgi:hypothetical protein